MPAIWTSARNERLLLLIVQNIKPDAAKLAKAWAEQYGDDEYKPTARAITEQFGVLKKKAAGKSAGGAATAATKGSGTPKTPQTPKTPTTTKASAKKTTVTITTTTTPSKRKQSSRDSDNDDDSEPDLKNLPNAISRASLARTKKTPKRYEESATPSEFGSDDEDAVAEVKREQKVNGTAPAAKSNGFGGALNGNDAEGDEIHVATPTNPSFSTSFATNHPTSATDPKLKTNGVNTTGGLDTIMRGLMADTGPSPSKKAKLAEMMEDESDVSDFAAGR